MTGEQKRAVEAIANRADLSPSMKRKALLAMGVKTEYQVHQGVKEMARRLKTIQKAS